MVLIFEKVAAIGQVDPVGVQDVRDSVVVLVEGEAEL